jgi:hypothetical protein
MVFLPNEPGESNRHGCIRTSPTRQSSPTALSPVCPKQTTLSCGIGMDVMPHKSYYCCFVDLRDLYTSSLRDGGSGNITLKVTNVALGYGLFPAASIDRGHKNSTS